MIAHATLTVGALSKTDLIGASAPEDVDATTGPSAWDDPTPHDWHTPSPDGRQAHLSATATRLATAALTSPLSPLDAALLTRLVISDPAVRDQVLATLTGHHTNDPSWLTAGPNNPLQLRAALAALQTLPADPGGEVAAMRAWVLWALHRPTQALATLHESPCASRFGRLLERVLAIAPAPPWKEDPSCRS